MIHLVTKQATAQQIEEMLQELKTYIKLAVDVRRRLVVGGGALHADCQAVLLDEGSDQLDIWGADWIPASREVRYESLINIRPKQDNRSMTITSPDLQSSIASIVRERFEG